MRARKCESRKIEKTEENVRNKRESVGKRQEDRLKKRVEEKRGGKEGRKQRREEGIQIEIKKIEGWKEKGAKGGKAEIGEWRKETTK